tara:strand:+ start:34 stop:552 length:519 start_codon:yes stop_codon:yes gene_type:complete
MSENKKFSIWLIGPAAAGKTTVSKVIFDRLKIKYPNLVLLDGDELRNLYDKNLGYDLQARKLNMLRYIKLAKWLSKQNICTIGAINGGIENDRALLRKEIENYKEIYLHSSREERIKRDKKGLYKKAIKGEIKNVLDVDISFEEPINCDLKINTENKKPEIIADQIISQYQL